MNRKEFDEKFFAELYDYMNDRQTDSEFREMLWQWIEQYGNQARVDENEEAREVIEFCKGALEDAIYCEDGLDGLAGERVIKMIVDWQSRIKELKDKQLKN